MIQSNTTILSFHNIYYLIPYYILLVILCINLTPVSAFNLDIDIPIIKTGLTKSYFGFSVAQHKIRLRSNKYENVMLVGAPLSNYIGKVVENPGAIYKCPLTPRMDDCLRVKVDDNLPPDKDENRNNQWLGVTIKSHKNGESVVTCGHRYSRSGSDYHWGFGICYSLSSSLEYEEVYSPCVGRPVFKAHQQFGYCQAGTSVFISTNDDLIIGAPGSYTWTGALFKNNIASGIFADKRWFFTPLEAPDLVPVPHYSFLGMSVLSGQFFGEAYSYVSGAPRANGTGLVVIFNKGNLTFSTTLVPVITLKGKDVLGSGFGYELAALDFNTDGYLDLLVGAPFYYETNDESVGGAVYIYLNGPNGLNEDNPIILTGKNESMFGYSISSIGDVNQDGYEDIAIGAPNQDNGLGAVYIYHGGHDKIDKHLARAPAQIITPSSLRYTDTQYFESLLNQKDGQYSFRDKRGENEILAFGHSLSGGIDMDSNGYPDLLIGSYRSDRIFLLRSRPIINVFSDVRELPNALDPQNPSAFSCPDSFKNNYSSSNAKRRNMEICFPIKVCFRFGAHPSSTFNSGLMIRYTLRAEKFGLDIKKPFSRISFLPQSSNELNYDWAVLPFDATPPEDKSFMTSNILKLAPQISHQYVCDVKVAFLKPDTKDFLRPISFQLTVNLTSSIPEQFTDELLVDINTYPILNQDVAIKTFQVQFLKDCGENDICESELQLETLLKLPLSREKVPILTLGQNKELSLQTSVENFGEAAYETELFVHFSSGINYIGVKVPSILFSNNKKLKNYLCSLINVTLIKCEIGNPLKADDRVEFVFNFDVTTLKLEDNNITFFVNVTTTSSDKNIYPKNFSRMALIIIKSEISLTGVSSPEQIFYGGIIKGESSMVYERDVGNSIEHRYIVINHGPGTIGSSYVDVMWPYEVENKRKHGKWLLYMTRYPWVDGNGMCEIDSNFVNLLKLELETPSLKSNLTKNKTKNDYLHVSTSIVKRFKRKIKKIFTKIVTRNKRELIILPEAKMLGGKLKNIVTMDCLKGTAKCVKFTCHIGELSSSESIVIHLQSRLWNSTLVEDYPLIDAVAIISRAFLYIDKKYHVEQNISNDEAYIETIAYPDLDVITEHKETEPWIIIVAICSGIFLFFLITILLWKIGFFKRKIMKPPHSARLEKARYDDMNDL